MPMIKPEIGDPEARKAEWLARLDALVTLVQDWAGAAGWSARRLDKSVTEPGLGRYEVPILLLSRDGVEVALSPLARVAPDADGVVDLYQMPGYDDLASLAYLGERWFIRASPYHDSTAPRPAIGAEYRPLEEDTLNRVLAAAGADA